MSKVGQYAIDDAKVCHGFHKWVLNLLEHHCKKPLLGLKIWDACIIVGQLMTTFKTPLKAWFASRVILFQKILEYQNPISICYGW